jgi:hypothetical protein
MPEPGGYGGISEEYLTRLPYLWTDVDKWWIIKTFHEPDTVADIDARAEPLQATAAQAAVAPLVDDAIGRIKQFGVPYLEELSCVYTGKTHRQYNLI